MSTIWAFLWRRGKGKSKLLKLSVTGKDPILIAMKSSGRDTLYLSLHEDDAARLHSALGKKVAKRKKKKST